MEKDVFLYKIGESLFCPDCIEDIEKELSKDSKIPISKKALTIKDIKCFICNKCKKIFNGEETLSDIEDRLERTLSKIHFISDYVWLKSIEGDVTPDPDKTMVGFAFVLKSMEDDLEQAIHNLGIIKQRTKGEI